MARSLIPGPPGPPFIGDSGITLPGLDTTTVLRSPMQAPRWPQRWMPAAIAPNLLLTLLAPLSQAPFVNNNFDLPRAPPRISQNWSTNLLETTLAPVAAAPFVNTNDGLSARWRETSRRDVFGGGPLYSNGEIVPFANVDYSSPKAAPRLLQSWVQNLLQSTLAPATPAPFSNYDWPLPKAAPRIPQSWVSSGPLPPEIAPFANTNQDTPARRADIRQSWLSPAISVIPVPFSNYDWQVPRAAVRLLQSWITQGPLPPEIPPFTNGAGSLPVSPARLLQSWVGQAIQIVIQPFSNADWPLPVRARQIDRSWISPALATPPATPFFNPDFGTPGRRLEPFVYGQSPLALFQAGTPFANYDWPLPRRAPRIDQSWSTNLLQTTLAPPASVPFRNTEFRVPQAPYRLQQGWSTNLLQSTLAGGGIRPPSQSDWPLPQRQPNPRRVENLQQLAQYLPISIPLVVTLNGQQVNITQGNISLTVVKQVGRQVLPPKLVGATQLLDPVFEFGESMAPTESITSASMVCSVYTGVDASPSSLLKGAVLISGTQIGQMMTGGIVGVVYQLLCTAKTSGGQTLQQTAYYYVEPPLP